MKIGKKIIWLIALILVVVLIGVVGYGYYRKITMKVQNPVATMEVEGYGIIPRPSTRNCSKFYNTC